MLPFKIGDLVKIKRNYSYSIDKNKANLQNKLGLITYVSKPKKISKTMTDYFYFHYLVDGEIYKNGGSANGISWSLSYEVVK